MAVQSTARHRASLAFGLALAVSAFTATAFGSASAEQTTAWAAAPVPAITVMPGDALDAGMLTQRRFRQDWLDRNPFMRDASALNGMIAVRMLPKGRPIPQSSVAPRPAVVAGQSATVIFDGGALQIATLMMAMDGGAEGDQVRMRNAETGAVIHGRVTGYRRVTVGR
jgi:flagellar basal body P-ring formation protein FlgA